MQVYNTLSRGKEEFAPMHDRAVNMFVCGQTVYDDAHLGHARTYIAFDIVVRWLKHLGYKVNYVQNITDIDDKIIARAREKGIEPIELARQYEQRFMEDMDRVGVKQNVSSYPRSHDYITAIKEQIQLLLDKDFAYLLEGDVYYDVAKFRDYTALSGMKMDELEKHRIEPKEGKRNVYDFVLWKASKPGEPSWDVEVHVDGKAVRLSGRPGWHIEDTAITHSIFGPQYDLHGGASELMFPHHTNEIAQAEAAFGVKPFVKYWMHSGVLNIKGQKMSKSLRNFITIRDLLAKYPAEALRFFVASTHYRKEINYTEELMRDANKLMYYVNQSVGILNNLPADENASGEELVQAIGLLEKEFTEAMDDDFNTSLALMRLTTAMRRVRQFSDEKGGIDQRSKETALGKIVALGDLLGIMSESLYKQALSAEVVQMIKKREELRRTKNFDEADRMRAEIESKHGIKIEDTEYGTVWYPGGAPSPKER
ncbi:MAG: cysteine--tRNA ligase [Candidatus Marsarchaeota archaeon]|nr:cysteine--tRNA ligase [Candidatus Marsarchaeota archaeon]